MNIGLKGQTVCSSDSFQIHGSIHSAHHTDCPPSDTVYSLLISPGNDQVDLENASTSLYIKENVCTPGSTTPPYICPQGIVRKLSLKRTDIEESFKTL